MEFRILDKNFRDMVLLDRYESLLWVDRYDKCGDFELYTPPTDELLEYSALGNYLYSAASEHLMIIEHQELTTSYDQGQRIIIKGRSIESILDRRILWYKTRFENNLEDAIRQILDYSIIQPAGATWGGAVPDPDRKIDNFIFEYSGIPDINKIVINKSFDIGTDLLTVISQVCQAAKLGFKITLNNQNQFVFKLYKGANRSYSQFTNPWVVFSPRFENLITNEFVNDSTNYKNIVRTTGTYSKDDEKQDFDILTGGQPKENILVLDGSEYQIHDLERFAFTVGKLDLSKKYSFTANVTVDQGDVTQVLCRLVGDAPYTRIYSSKVLPIEAGRINGSFTLTQPDPFYTDCMFLEVHSSDTSGNLPLTPYRYDYNIGYVQSGSWKWESPTNTFSDIYRVEGNKTYYIALGNPVGTRFRAMFTTTDVTRVASGTNVTGISIINQNNPAVNAHTTYLTPDDGYIIISKDNVGTQGIKTYVYDNYDEESGSSLEDVITIKNPIFAEIKDIDLTGLNRREVYQSPSVETTEEMTMAQYREQLEMAAYNKLDDSIIKGSVSGTVEDKVSYEYNKDYFIGDIVQVENSFGILGTMRVTEFITSHSTSGIEMYPTFTSISGGDEENGS